MSHEAFSGAVIAPDVQSPLFRQYLVALDELLGADNYAQLVPTLLEYVKPGPSSSLAICEAVARGDAPLGLTTWTAGARLAPEHGDNLDVVLPKDATWVDPLANGLFANSDKVEPALKLFDATLTDAAASHYREQNVPSWADFADGTVKLGDSVATVAYKSPAQYAEDAGRLYEPIANTQPNFCNSAYCQNCPSDCGSCDHCPLDEN